MTGRVQDKVALVTGGARGQGRSHAVRLAEEGADVLVTDICAQIATVEYPMPTEEDLAETVRQVEALGRRAVSVVADVRDYDAMERAVGDAVTRLGRLDIIAANAGIGAYGRTIEFSHDQWQDMIDVNLTGVWHTIKAAAPHILRGGRGGSIVITSSCGGVSGIENMGHYVAAKHGVVGLMRTLAIELAQDRVRVNAVCPSLVETDQTQNDSTYRLFRPDLPNPTQEDALEAFRTLPLLPIDWIEPRDISNAVLFLASDEARYITGTCLPVDAGALTK